jgi:hypothetical protein
MGIRQLRHHHTNHLPPALCSLPVQLQESRESRPHARPRVQPHFYAVRQVLPRRVRRLWPPPRHRRSRPIPPPLQHLLLPSKGLWVANDHLHDSIRHFVPRRLRMLGEIRCPSHLHPLPPA